MSRTVHIIGAGVSGLAAAVALSDAGYVAHVHEATLQAGGRCRSYYDGATDLVIDNGNHLLLSANHHARAYAKRIGSETGLVGPDRALFPFFDLKSGKRWTLDLGDSRLPTWLFDDKRRVPDTSVGDYLKLSPLIWSGTERLVGDAIPCSGVLYDRLVQPLLLAALNVDPPEGSAGLAGAIVRETLVAGGQACRPLIARDGLSAVLVDPAIEYLKAKGGDVHLGHELRKIIFAGDRADELDFGADKITLGPDDRLIVAAPPRASSSLLPGLSAPTEFRAIVNAHFRYAPPKDCPPLTGVVGGTIEWLFAFHNRLSITISNADRLVNAPREELARTIWDEISKTAGFTAAIPPWQIVRERRATFASTPAQNKLRPGTTTQWRNVMLAGDWTDTGLPATIEGSIRSGDRAAEAILKTA